MPKLPASRYLAMFAAVACSILQSLPILLIAGSCARPERSRDSNQSPAEIASAAPNQETVVNADLGHRVDDFLTRMSGFGYSGNVLLVVDDETVLKKGYGMANRSTKMPYTSRTIFDIGSMAKTFTAVAILKLELARRLSVQDSISRFLPDVPDDKKAITIHQLLTHTSGIVVDFPYADPAVPYEDVGRDEAIRRLLAAPLEYPPGTGQGYSNGGYNLLGAIVEKASGQPFCEYMREAIFKPAGLKDTGFWAEKGFDASLVAIGYNEYGEPLHDPLKRSGTTWQDLGGGQMLSTLDDLERWWDQLADGKILPASSIARMWRPWTKNLSARGGDCGYGWFVQLTTRGSMVIQHGGDYMGTGAELQAYVEERVLKITSTNIRTDMFPTRNRTDLVIPMIIFGGDYAEPPAWTKNETLLRSCVGEYRLPTGGSLVVHEKNGMFFVGGRGQDAADLLMPPSDELRSRRRQLSEQAVRVLEGLRRGETDALVEAVGGKDASPGFVAAVQAELAGFGLGQLQKVSVVGTFASGYPRGNPLDYETTLLQLEFEQGQLPYAIRWANTFIAATDVPPFEWAADTRIQADASGNLVTWNIVFKIGTTITLQKENQRITALVVHGPGGDVVATQEASR